MPIVVKHPVHPYSNAFATVLLINFYRTPVSGVFRRNAFWFRGLWRKPGQRFAICGDILLTNELLDKYRGDYGDAGGADERAIVRYRFDIVFLDHRIPELHLVRQKLALHIQGRRSAS